MDFDDYWAMKQRVNKPNLDNLDNKITMTIRVYRAELCKAYTEGNRVSDNDRPGVVEKILGAFR